MKNTLSLILIILGIAPFAIAGEQSAQIGTSSVIDGDTFVTESGEKVRVLNINTPEIGTRNGKYAYYRARRLLIGKRVALIKETGKNKGRYGRSLYHVILPDGSNYAEKIIRSGWSRYWTKYGRSSLYDKEYRKAEKYAKRKEKGIWKRKK